MNEEPEFVTATILEWKHLLKKDKYKYIILDSLKFLVNKGRVQIYGFVIMPNHLHLIWHVCEDHTQSNIQRDFLRFTAQQIKFDLQANHPQLLESFGVNASDRKYQIWERNPRIIALHSSGMIIQKLDYIHNNPLQEHWQLSSEPEYYPFSSASFYESGIDRFGFLTDYREGYG